MLEPTNTFLNYRKQEKEGKIAVAEAECNHCNLVFYFLLILYTFLWHNNNLYGYKDAKKSLNSVLTKYVVCLA